MKLDKGQSKGCESEAYVEAVVAEDDRLAGGVEELAGIDEVVKLLESFGIAYRGHLAFARRARAVQS